MSTLRVVSPLHRLATPVQYHIGDHSLIITSDYDTPDAPALALPSPDEEPGEETIILNHDETYHLYQCLHTLLFMSACEEEGAPLSKTEMRKAIHPLFMARLKERETSNRPQAWYHGWSQEYILALLDAEREVASEQAPPGTDLQAERAPVAGTHTFRKAVIQTESMDDLALGILCGQDCFVQFQCENPSITSKHLATLFIETMKSDEPEPFNVGFLIGFVDALLRARKTYPRG